jgi:hypothetical protein
MGEQHGGATWGSKPMFAHQDDGKTGAVLSQTKNSAKGGFLIGKTKHQQGDNRA